MFGIIIIFLLISYIFYNINLIRTNRFIMLKNKIKYENFVKLIGFCNKVIILNQVSGEVTFIYLFCFCIKNCYYHPVPNNAD